MAKRQKSVKIRSGDVFQFEIAGASTGYVQIITPGDVMYVVVYKDICTDPERLFDPKILSEIILCGWTLDARIYHGIWKFVGNAPVPEDVPRPCYKVGRDGILWVKSFDDEPIRPASEKDCQLLEYRTTVAPIRFEKAFAAIYGLQEWDDSFDKMRVEYARERERAC